MAKKKYSDEELKRRTQERNRKYWEEHREEIALKRKAKREQAKAEKQAREKLYQEQVETFMRDIQADEEAMVFIRAILDGGNPRELIEAWAKEHGETEK